MYIKTDDFTIYSCYSPGNDEINELVATLSEIGNKIRIHNEAATVAGHFNAKSPQWE